MGTTRKTTAAMVAKKCDDAYSYGRYAPGEWVKAARMLMGRGYTAAQSEAVLRSKWTRWAADMAEADYGTATAAHLEAFLDRGAGWPKRQSERDAVAELERGT